MQIRAALPSEDQRYPASKPQVLVSELGMWEYKRQTEPPSKEDFIVVDSSEEDFIVID